MTVQISLVPGSEPVGEPDCAVALRELEYGFAEACAGSNRAIGGRAVDGAFAVDGEAAASLPNGGSGTGRLIIERAQLLQGRGVISHHPSFFFAAAASVGPESNIEIAIVQAQSRAVYLHPVDEHVVLAVIFVARRNHHRTARLLKAGRHIERVQAVDK